MPVLSRRFADGASSISPVLSVRVPATVTSITAPRGFLERGAAYKYEVLAIEVSGNQTLTSAAFTTR